MFATKNDLIRFLKMIEEKKINIDKDFKDFKDYKDYWLYNQDNPECLNEADWTYLKLLFDSDRLITNPEIHDWWKEEIQRIKNEKVLKNIKKD